MKISVVFFVALVCKIGAENNDINNFAEYIFNFYNATVTAIRDNYSKEPLNGVPYGPAFNINYTADSKNYVVTLNNITMWSTEVKDRTIAVEYHCISEDELRLSLARVQNENLKIDSQVKLQEIPANGVSEGSLTQTFSHSITNRYELNTVISNVLHVMGQSQYTSNMTEPQKQILLDAVSNSDYLSRIKSFVTQTMTKDGYEKVNGKIFSDFSKTTCNKLSNEKSFPKTIIAGSIVNETNAIVQSIAIESVDNFTDVNFKIIFNKNGYFAVKFGQVKIQTEYVPPGETKARNLEYIVKSFKITINLDQENLQVGQFQNVKLAFESTENERAPSLAELAIRTYVQILLQIHLSDAISDQFNPKKL